MNQDEKEFKALIAVQADCETAYKRACEAMRLWDFNRNHVGLLPDSIRMTPGYKKDKKAVSKALAKLQSINTVLTRDYKHRYKQYRELQRGDKP